MLIAKIIKYFKKKQREKRHREGEKMFAELKKLQFKSGIKDAVKYIHQNR